MKRFHMHKLQSPPRGITSGIGSAGFLPFSQKKKVILQFFVSQKTSKGFYFFEDCR